MNPQIEYNRVTEAIIFRASRNHACNHRFCISPSRFARSQCPGSTIIVSLEDMPFPRRCCLSIRTRLPLCCVVVASSASFAISVHCKRRNSFQPRSNSTIIAFTTKANRHITQRNSRPNIGVQYMMHLPQSSGLRSVSAVNELL